MAYDIKGNMGFSLRTYVPKPSSAALYSADSLVVVAPLAPPLGELSAKLIERAPSPSA